MIYFDFDGTIVDVWQRYYQVFLAAGGVSGLGSKEYIAAKRRLGKDDLVAAALGVLLSLHSRSFLQRITMRSGDYWRRQVFSLLIRCYCPVVF